VGETIYNIGDSADQSAFILVSGSVDIVDSSNHVVLCVDMECTFFGEKSLVFDEPRHNTARSNSFSTILFIPGHEILLLLEKGDETRFSQTFSGRVRSIENTIGAYSDFEFHLRSALDAGSLDIRRLIPSYEALEPAIHSGMKSQTLDISAWSYAINRLPRDINSFFALIVSSRSLSIVRNHLHLGESVPTKMRRRTCRLILPGKAFILLRPGQSDIMDLVTCLCLHFVESVKLRHYLRPMERTLALISNALHRIHTSESADRRAITTDVLSKVSSRFTASDIQSLHSIWPTDLLEQIHSVCLHHGDYVLYTDNVPVEVSVASASDNWENRLLAATHQLIGAYSDTDLIVDIISSNTTSVYDCLSPYLHLNRSNIEKWADTGYTDFETGLSQDDTFYLHSHKYFESFPHLQAARKEYDSKAGIYTVDEHEFTGITVQLFDLSRLKETALGNSSIDASISEVLNSRSESRRHLLVNIDYAFGEQAQHVLRSLLLTYGRLVRSVSVMGKAGSLTGSRGDILFPTHFIHEKGDIPVRILI
jgi:hypothetical protein